MKIIVMGLVALLLFVLQKRIYKRHWHENLKVSVGFAQSDITEGENGEIIQVIENRKRLPLSMLKVKFQTSGNLEFASNKGSKTTDLYYRNEIFQIGGGEKITRRLTFKGKKRGYYHIKNIDLIGTDLFFTDEYVKSMSTDSYMYVYPKAFQSEELRLSLQKLNGEVLVKQHLLEDPFEYRGIRAYQPFDDIRSVNWKATARTGSLKVNQKNYTAVQTVRIFLNLEDGAVYKKEREAEAAIQIVMGLADFFLSQNIKVSLHTNARDILTDEAINLSGGAGLGQRESICKALARIDTKKAPLPFAELFYEEIIEHSDGIVTLFVSPNGFKDFLQLLLDCESKGIEYSWFYPHGTSEAPEVPDRIRKHVHFLHLDQF